MSDTVVARLRERVERESRVVGTCSYRYRDELLSVLDVVERFAAVEPLADESDDGWVQMCTVCFQSGFGSVVHRDDCPWLAARRLCGMEPANAEDGDA